MTLLECAPVGAPMDLAANQAGRTECVFDDCTMAGRIPAVPSEYKDRAIRLLGVHPSHLCVGGPSYRLQKAYKYLSSLHHPTHPRGTWRAGEPMADGDWEEIGPTFISEHSVREVWLDELRDWVELLNWLGPQDDSALITGRLRSDSRTEPYFGRWLVPNKEKAHYADDPTRWFIVDVDDLGGDSEDADCSVKEFIAEYLPEFDGAGVVVAFTGSAGIKGKGTRVRLIFELAEPRTLAAQLAFVDSVNKRGGAGDILDRSICKPGHLILTAEPHLAAPVENGSAIRWTKVPRPLPPVRVWHVPGDLVSIPDVAPAAVSSSTKVGGNPMALSATKKEVADVLASMGPGNYDRPIHWYVCHLAFKTPPTLRDVTLDAAIGQLAERIVATSEPDLCGKRLKTHLNRDRLLRKWAKALAARVQQQRPLIGAQEAAEAAPLTLQAALAHRPRDIASVRQQLSADTARVTAELLGGERKHALLTPAPGTGKTRALLGSVTPGSLVSNLMRVLSPDHRLAAQSCADAKSQAATLTPDGKHYGFDLAALVRHHKGRSHEGMCTDRNCKPKADRAERLGLSPKAHVCPSCPTGQRGACRWLEQSKDNGPGVIFETHANILHRDPAHDNTDLYVFDEGVLGTILAGKKTGASATEHVSLKDLLYVDIRRRPRYGARAGTTRPYVTNRLRHIRMKLVDALTSCLSGVDKGIPVRPTVACLSWLFDPTEYREFDNGKLVQKAGALLDAARSLERQQQRSLADHIVSADDAGRPTGDLYRQLNISREAMTILDAVEASRDRLEVFALTVYAKGKAREAYAWAGNRFAGLADLLRGRSLSLDGTAVADVWRALISPDGSSFAEEIISADPEVPVGGTYTTVYHDCSGATSLFVGLDPSADAEDAAELDDLEQAAETVRTVPWLRNAFEPDEYEKLLKDTDDKAQEKRSQRVRRKLRCDANIDQLWKFIVTEALNATRSVLVAGRSTSVLLVTTKRVKLRLQGLGLPPNVAVEHFGAIRGLNAYSQVPIAIIVGRNRPSNIALEMAAEALCMFNTTIKTIDRYHPDPKQGRRWEEVHPDPLVRQVQDVITLGEVRQAVARIRAFDRTPENPCRVHVIGDYDPGIRVDTTAHWLETLRSPAEVALAAGALFQRPASNQAVYPELFAKKLDGGAAYADARIPWAHYLASLVREIRPYLNKYIGEAESEFPIRDKDEFRGQLSGYKLVKFKRARTKADGVRGTYSEYAIVRATWDQARLERLMGATLVSFKEAGLQELQREADNASVRAFDGR